MKTFLKKASFFLILTFAVFLTVNFVSAQQLDTGQQQVDETIILDNPDPRVIAARIVQIALGFLGILALALIIYAGYIWMTSAGNSERVDRAKDILKNAIIGLLIILSAFGIVSFIISQLLSGVSGGGTGGGGSGRGFEGGRGALGACSLESVYPAPDQKEVPRNTSIIMTFREEVDSSTVCNVGEGEKCEGQNIRTDGRIKIYKSDVDPENDSNWVADVSVHETGNHKTFVLVPDEYLGSPSEFVWYNVYLSNDIRERGGEGKGVFEDCRMDYYNWRFQVSDEIDLTPPQVQEKGVFPQPDGEQDDYSVAQEASRASGAISVDEQPELYSKAISTSVTSIGDAPTAEVQVAETCRQEGTLTVTVDTDGATARLNKDDILLGESVFNGTVIEFPGILSLTVAEGGYNAGDSWEIEVDSMQEADTITVNNRTFVFAENSDSGDSIQLGSSVAGTASNIASALNGMEVINASADGSTVDITAQEAGEAGNDIYLSTGTDSPLVVTPMSGGVDEDETVTVNGKPDQPRNSIIQINFNEAVNPVTVSGDAENLSSYIRVVCQKGNCSDDNYFFDCGGERCIKGRFLTSDQYSTVEFRSNNQCDTNACGQPIYCLPGDTELRTELEAATLNECSGDDDCLSRAPYTVCTGQDSTVDACVNDQNTPTTTDDINYPMSDPSMMDGVMDVALNSLDGNRDGEAQGPISYFDLNAGNAEYKDSFRWSFFINDEIKIKPPAITDTNPDNNGNRDDLVLPIDIDFDSLMMSDSLSTGSTLLSSGEEEIEHKLINIWNYTDSGVGYWVAKDNIDSEEPFDGWPDTTRAHLKHTMLEESVTYRTQVGSGVLDIYQNCFKPSDGPACSLDSVTETEPSCCAGFSTQNLNKKGNCPRSLITIEDVKDKIKDIKISSGKMLGNITNDWCSDCSCRGLNLDNISQEHTCIIDAKEALSSLGYETSPVDPWGNYYLIDENELEWEHAPCRKDVIRSAGPDGFFGNSDDIGERAPFTSEQCQ
jgi:hypothetical protein